MTKRLPGITIIQAEKSRRCELCGKLRELRPYGPGGKSICFDCGKKDEAGTRKRMHAHLFGDDDN